MGVRNIVEEQTSEEIALAVQKLNEEIEHLNGLFSGLTGLEGSCIASVNKGLHIQSVHGDEIQNVELLISDIEANYTKIDETLYNPKQELLKKYKLATLVVHSIRHQGSTYYLIAFDHNEKNLDETKRQAISYCVNQLKRILKNYQYELARIEKLALTREELEIKRRVYSETTIGTWIYYLDEDKVEWSEEAYKILEIPKGSSLSFDQFLSTSISENRRDIQSVFTETRKEGETFDVVFRLATSKDNKWIRCKGEITTSKSKQVLVGSMQDITTIQDRNFKFEGIFNSTYTFIGFLDVNGTLLEANDTALKMAGIQRKDVVGKKFWDCYWWQISKETQNTLKERFNQVLVTGEEVSYDVKVWIENREEITILFSLKPVKDSRGNILYVVPEGRPIQDLVDSRKRYKNVIRGGQIGVWEWNMKTGEAVYNEEWKNILNIGLHALSKPTIDDWYNLIHENDLLTVKTLIKENILEKKQRFTVEFRMKTAEQKDVWIEATMNVHNTDRAGYPELVYGNARDITKRRIAEDELLISENAFRSNFENAAIGMALISEKGGWLKVNDRISAILGYSKEELSEITFQDITHPEDLEKDINLLEEIIRGERGHYQMEKRYFHKDGSIIHAILGVSVVRNYDGKIRHFISQIIDITELKQIHRQLEMRNDDLEQFAHIAAHDLQQPLRTVTNYLSLYKKKFADQLDRKQELYVDNAIGGALKMKELIKGILDFSVTRDLDKEEIDLSSLLQGIAKSLKKSQDKEVNINIGKLPTINADTLTLKQLFSNLIENGLKYQEQNNIPRVDVVYKDLGTSWLFSVIDNGIGMREDHFERVFNLFQRLHSHDRYKGNGIGLATCKKIVNAYEGSIWLEHNKPTGLKVHIKLPKNA